MLVKPVLRVICIDTQRVTREEIQHRNYWTDLRVANVKKKSMLRPIDVFLVYFAAFLKSGHTLIYECYPNATLKVENPGSFPSVFACNSVKACTTKWSARKSHVFISDCEMDDEILLFFSNLSPSAVGVIGGTDRGNTFIINCVQIPKSGEFTTVSVSFEVRLGLDLSNFPHVAISSNVYEDVSSKTLATEVPVGTPLFWVMETELDDFDLRPDECWVYRGKTVSDNSPRKYLIKDGCSLTKDLVHDFQWYKPEIGTMVWTVLSSFRFYGSEFVTMQCRVRVCLRPSTACRIDCSDKKRRRRMNHSGDGQVDNSTGDMIERRKEAEKFRVITNNVRVVEFAGSSVKCTRTSESTCSEMEFVWLFLAWIVLKIF